MLRCLPVPVCVSFLPPPSLQLTHAHTHMAGPQVHSLEWAYIEDIQKQERRRAEEMQTEIVALDLRSFDKQMASTVRERKKMKRPLTKDDVDSERENFEYQQVRMPCRPMCACVCKATALLGEKEALRYSETHAASNQCIGMIWRVVVWWFVLGQRQRHVNPERVKMMLCCCCCGAGSV
jgi:hypothetical protein